MTKLIGFRKWKNKNVLSRKRARVHVVLHWQMQQEKKEEKKPSTFWVHTDSKEEQIQAGKYLQGQGRDIFEEKYAAQNL